MIPSDLWWNYVPAGASIRNEIVQQIMAGRCILLDTSRLPWRSTLTDAVRDQVLSHDAELNWNEIDAEEIAGHKPMDYLASYFGADRIPVQTMILQNIRALPSCCWVHNIPESEVPGWLQLAQDLFGGKEKSSFRLVLELPSVSIRSLGKIAVVRTKAERFDLYYFALSILAAGRLGENFREYAATLCAEIADGDAEQCCALCKNVDSVLRDPLAACAADNDEPLQKQLVCRAQTRSISPLIDIGRLKLISIFRRRIEIILPQQDDYGNELSDVNSVELRHLVYFSGTGLMNLTPKEKDMLYCLYNARNIISHLDILPYPKVQELFRVLDELA